MPHRVVLDCFDDCVEGATRLVTFVCKVSRMLDLLDEQERKHFFSSNLHTIAAAASTDLHLVTRDEFCASACHMVDHLQKTGCK